MRLIYVVLTAFILYTLGCSGADHAAIRGELTSDDFSEDRAITTSRSSGDNSGSTVPTTTKRPKVLKVAKVSAKKKQADSSNSESSIDEDGSSDELSESDSEESGSLSPNDVEELLSMSDSDLNALLASLGGSDLNESGLKGVLASEVDSNSGSSLDSPKVPTKKKKAKPVESTTDAGSGSGEISSESGSQSVESELGSDSLSIESVSSNESSFVATKTPKKNSVRKKPTSEVSDDGSDLSLPSSDGDSDSGNSPNSISKSSAGSGSGSNSYLDGLMSLSGSDLLPSSLNEAVKKRDSVQTSTSSNTKSSACGTGWWSSVKSWWNNTFSIGDKCSSTSRTLRVD